jgi:hypothetical protein
VTGAYAHVSSSVQEGAVASVQEGVEAGLEEDGSVRDEGDGGGSAAADPPVYSYEHYSFGEVSEAWDAPLEAPAARDTFSEHWLNDAHEASADDEEAEPEMPDDIPDLPTASGWLGDEAAAADPSLATPEAHFAGTAASGAAAAPTQSEAETPQLTADEAARPDDLSDAVAERPVAAVLARGDGENASQRPVLARYRVEGIDSAKMHAEL